MRSRVSQALFAGIDSSLKADQAWELTIQHCLKPVARLEAITLSIVASYDPVMDRLALGQALRVLTERLSWRYHRRASKKPLLQAAFVLESPERMLSASRVTAGNYHRHIHGLIEVPAAVQTNDFAEAVRSCWAKSRFYAPGNNHLVKVGDLDRWVRYICKRGSHNPLTDCSMFNDLLFESLRSPARL